MGRGGMFGQGMLVPERGGFDFFVDRRPIDVLVNVVHASWPNSVRVSDPFDVFQQVPHHVFELSVTGADTTVAAHDIIQLDCKVAGPNCTFDSAIGQGWPENQ